MERGIILLIFICCLACVALHKEKIVKVSILDAFSAIALVATVLYFVYQMWFR